MGTQEDKNLMDYEKMSLDVWASGLLIVGKGSFMYFSKVLDFQPLMRLICKSEKPKAAAHKAAPIRKLWVLYQSVSRLQNERSRLRELTNCDLGTWELSGQQNKGPERCLLTLRYLAIVVTGPIGCDLWSKMSMVWVELLCLKNLRVNLMALLSPLVDARKEIWFG